MIKLSLSYQDKCGGIAYPKACTCSGHGFSHTISSQELCNISEFFFFV